MKKQTLDLAKIDVKSLKEFNGFEKSQILLVKDNPFIAVVDHKTYELGKKAAHALLKGRTGLESQERLIVKNIGQLRKGIGEATSTLIDITRPAEMKQKTEIQTYENKKAEEKRLKEEAEAKILEQLRKDIDDIDETTTEAIENMTYEKIDKVAKLLEGLSDIDGTIFGGLEELFDDTCILLRERFNTKKRGLVIAFEQAKKEKELAAREAKLKKAEAARKAKAKKEAEARKKEDERRRKEDEDRERADKESKIAALQSSHVIALLKAGYKEGNSNIFEKSGNKISLLTFTDRGGNITYRITDKQIDEFIAYGQKIEYRVDTLNEFKDFISIEKFAEVLRYEDDAFQLEINKLIEKRDAPNDTIFVVDAPEEIDVKDIEVIDPEIIGGLIEETFNEEINSEGNTATGVVIQVQADKENLLKCINSFGLDFIPEEFNTDNGAMFMNVIYDKFETVKAALETEINEKF